MLETCPNNLKTSSFSKGPPLNCLGINPFRKKHLLQILYDFEASKCPADVALGSYFHAHRAIGAKDRRWISETFYGMTRWQGLIDHFSARPITFESRLETFLKIRPVDYEKDISIPPHVRVSFPKNFYNYLVQALGEEKAWEFCLSSNEQAPITIRTNLLKTNRESLMDRLQNHANLSPCVHSPSGLTFAQRVPLFSLPEFKEGLFEVQDEASQLVAALITAAPGDHVLDFCSGSGGKTLAFAPSLQGKGQIYLHDVRASALEQAKKRLHRAGIQNAQIIHSDDRKKSSLKNHMDWVLVDAPCSGSGTLRRNPDMKWKFCPADIDRLVALQREIFKDALDFVKPNGRIIYATCSVLPQENWDQIRFFEQTYNLQLEQEPFSSFPSKGGMDGFFAAVFKSNGARI